MSLHARCPQRIAGISAIRTLRRWRGARCYASYTTKEPEWFQKKRNILLARKRHHHHELLDVTSFSELRATLEGFEPDFDYGSSAPVKLQRVHLSTLLTRFNARVAASQLFADGTDPLHSPGKLWPRRMWAGGAVRVNPHPELDSETPFRLMQMVSCVERIKDVRLLGSDEKANIVVTVERSYTPHGTTTDWSSAWVKEERNLVFLKAKTAAELTSIHAGELLVPKYLEAPVEPDFTHSLTPTQTLLFRYSAITYNAHLLHLDPTYARNIEGHRNLLVHGPLTLTLMLQSAKKHFQALKFEDSNQRVESIEYRNLAPLYCDEEMRICVKEKRRTDTGSVWDVWIEGPTGGMAVKALVRSVRMPPQRKVAPPSPSAVALPYLYSGGSPGRSPLLAGIRVRWKRDAPAVQVRPLPYLYAQGSPLMAWIQPHRLFKPKPTATDERSEPRPTATSSPPNPPPTPADQPAKTPPKPATINSLLNPPPTPTKKPYQVNPRNLNVRRYSRRWLSRRVGHELRYLYFTHASPLFNTNTVDRSPPPEQDIKTSYTSNPSLRRGQTGSSSAAPARRFTLAQRQRAVLLALPRSPPTIRKVENTVAPEVLSKLPRNEADKHGGTHSPASGEAEAEAGTGASVVKQGKQRTQRTWRRFKIRKMEGTVIRKTDINLKETAVRRFHAHRKMVLPPVRER